MSTHRPCLDCKPGKKCRVHQAEELRVLAQARALEQAKAAERDRKKHTCPECGCHGRTCPIVFADGAGEGVCAPAGDLGLKVCSACMLKASPREAVA